MPMRAQLQSYLKEEADNSDSEWVLGAPVSVRTSFETLMTDLGLENVTPHTLRHTFISHLLINREPVFTVSKIVAVSIAQIERTYGHLTRDHMRAALENSIRY
jgi:integrase